MKWEELIVILHLDTLLLLQGGARVYIFVITILFVILYFIVDAPPWLPFKGSSWESDIFKGRIYNATVIDFINHKDSSIVDDYGLFSTSSNYVMDSSNSFLGSKPISCEAIRIDDYNTTPINFALQPRTALSCFVYIIVSLSLFYIFFADLFFLCRTNSQLIVREDSLRRLERVEEHASMPSLLTREPLWTLVFAFNFLLIGITGIMYHASLTLFTFRLDNYAWWALGSTFAGYSLTRFLSDGFPPDANICCILGKIGIVCFLECEARGKQRNSALFTTLSLVAVLIFDLSMGLQLDLADSKPKSVGILLILFITFIFFLWLHWLFRSNDISMRWTFVGFAFASALIGIIGLQIDDVFCDPHSWFQGHVIWHVSTCICAFSVYLFLRTDAWTGLSDIKKVEIISKQRNESIAHDLEQQGLTINSQLPKRTSNLSATGVSQLRTGLDARASVHSLNSQARNNSLSRPVSNQLINQNIPARNRESNLSHNSIGSHHSVQSNQYQHRSGPPQAIQQNNNIKPRKQSEKVYWVCTFCDFATNELSWEHCDRCGHEREIL